MPRFPTRYSRARPRRRSLHITRKQATNFAPAIRLAEKLGRPLNWFVTMNFAQTACAPEDVSDAFAKLRDNHFTPWLRRPGKGVAEEAGGPAYFIWVIENPNGHIGAHWMLNLHPSRVADFKVRLPEWLERVTGGVHCAVSAIDMKPVHNAAGLRQYFMKGTEPSYAAFCRINAVAQGEVVGKRSGFSRTLGPSRCREARTYYTQIRRDRLNKGGGLAATNEKR